MEFVSLPINSPPELQSAGQGLPRGSCSSSASTVCAAHKDVFDAGNPAGAVQSGNKSERAIRGNLTHEGVEVESFGQRGGCRKDPLESCNPGVMDECVSASCHGNDNTADLLPATSRSQIYDAFGKHQGSDGRISPCRLLKISGEIGLDQQRVLRLLCKEWSMDFESFMSLLENDAKEGEGIRTREPSNSANNDLQAVLYSSIDRKKFHKTLQHCRAECKTALANLKENEVQLLALRMVPSIVDDILLLREEVASFAGANGFPPSHSHHNGLGSCTEKNQDEAERECWKAREHHADACENLETRSSEGDSLESSSSSSDDSEEDMSGIEFSRRESSVYELAQDVSFSSYGREVCNCSAESATDARACRSRKHQRRQRCSLVRLIADFLPGAA
eukprot:404322-Hanusia_phi.AAC.4